MRFFKQMRVFSQMHAYSADIQIRFSGKQSTTWRHVFETILTDIWMKLY